MSSEPTLNQALNFVILFCIKPKTVNQNPLNQNRYSPLVCTQISIYIIVNPKEETNRNLEKKKPPSQKRKKNAHGPNHCPNTL